MSAVRAAVVFVASLCAIVMISAAVFAEGGASMPSAFKSAKGDTLMLPPVPPKGSVSVEEAIWLRRSVRRFSEDMPSNDIVSRLLWAAQGITDRENGLRSAPSAGATYPLEVFLATPVWLAQYVPEKHCLVVTLKEDVRKALATASLGQDWFAKAPLIFIFTAVVARTAQRYDERANLYVPIEVGCASENLMLEAAANGFGSVAVGAFREKTVSDILKLPDGWDSYLIVPVGAPAK
jgi:SagB-type dehydrogenase family enzyme